jgi:hypothetical protein
MYFWELRLEPLKLDFTAMDRCLPKRVRRPKGPLVTTKEPSRPTLGTLLRRL